MITWNTAVATARLTAGLTALDIGANALLVVGTSALSGATGVLVTYTLADPSASISGRVWTFLGTPISATSGAAGIAAKAELRTSAGVVVASGLTVGLVGSACDIIVDATTIIASRTCYFISGVITHP